MKKPICNQNLPEWARGWLAGVIDEEGTITVRKKRRKNSGNVNYVPILIVNNTNLKFIERIKEICGCGSFNNTYMRSFIYKKVRLGFSSIYLE